MRVPRCIYSGISDKVVSYELHGFGDASDRAYCAMVYLVCVTHSRRYVRLIASKTRVAPLAKQVTARLELMAGRITAQLNDAVEKALQSRIAINQCTLVVRQYYRLILDQGREGVEPVCTEQSGRDFETDHKRAMEPLSRRRKSSRSWIAGCDSNDNQE